MNTSSALDPQSPQARAIYDLAIHSTVIFALIFVIVTGAIIYAIFRFRAWPGEPDPKQILGNLTTFGCKRISRALTSANARNSAGPSMPGCASWLWPTNLQSSRNGNALSYNQRNQRLATRPQRARCCFGLQPASTVMQFAE